MADTFTELLFFSGKANWHVYNALKQHISTDQEAQQKSNERLAEGEEAPRKGEEYASKGESTWRLMSKSDTDDRPN